MSQKMKVLNILSEGNTLSRAQATRRGINNLNKIVSELRSEGYPVYFNSRSNSNKSHYRLGTPTRSMIAAAYALGGASAFTN